LKILDELSAFLVNIIKSRSILKSLIKNDFKQRYLGSFLGIAWAFIQPTITILIFWFVFQVGFKSQPVSNYPFILWLISGMIPWFFFADSLQNATHSVMGNSFLVKKVVFQVNILPLVKIASSLFVHLFFIVFMFVMFVLYGYTPDLYWLQIFYYLFATIILVLGLSWISSSLIVFLKDVGEFIAMILQFGFWLTPIFWNLSIVPQKYQYLLKLNPLLYITEGYRDAMINKVWFWEHPNMSIYFWVVTLVMLVGGMLVFRKLRPHFADVL
jgi:lipopolysaccharide transport system permease protein/teichoic acid transport system permease protein